MALRREIAVTPDETAVNRAILAAEDVWSVLRDTIYVRRLLGLPGDGALPRVTPDGAAQRAALGRRTLEALRSVDLARLPHDLGITARVLEQYGRMWENDDKRYWLVDDPLYSTFYGPFSMTPYTGGLLFNFIGKALAEYRFEQPGDADRYLALLADTARMVDEMRIRTVGQAERGIRMPRVQLPAVRALLAGLKAGTRAFCVSAERLEAVAKPAAAAAATEQRVADLLVPAFARFEAVFDADYERQAPETVGLWQYPEGDAVYADLVKMHTTLDLTVEQVHAAGHERMRRIHAEMDELRGRVGFKGDRAAFHAMLQKDARWIARTPDEVAERLRHHMNKFKPVYPKYFSQQPAKDYDVARLDPKLEGGVTFGYYQEPQPHESRGLYMYNGANLGERSMISCATLIYHELMPGHHLHLATQRNNPDLHPLRRFAFINAYNEGWAEYAATMAGEAGMYDDPYDRYGRLLMDAFLTTRLVVDTGMNAMRWPLEKARQYMRDTTMMSEAEIQSESIRYSCGIPAQSLAYKLGDEKLLELRARMKQRLGPRFDIRKFHDAVLLPGAMPLSALDWHIDHAIASA
jgi:uncharacterized protein (DUF885 family)